LVVVRFGLRTGESEHGFALGCVGLTRVVGEERDLVWIGAWCAAGLKLKTGLIEIIRGVRLRAVVGQTGEACGRRGR